VHFALRQKTRLGALRVHGDVLMLQSLLWSDEVREASFPALDERVRITAKELDMSSALVDSFASDFSPEDFTDDYQEQLRTLIDAKLEQGEALDTEATFGEQPEKESGGEVIDLMEALRRSVERNAAKKKPTAKKTAAAKKPAAKKPAAKKSATEKEPAAARKRRA
jgi:DNA end-binding protein Ku